MLEIGHFIDGVHTAGRSGQFGEVFNPATGEVQAHVALASAEELETAVGGSGSNSKDANSIALQLQMCL